MLTINVLVVTAEGIPRTLYGVYRRAQILFDPKCTTGR